MYLIKLLLISIVISQAVALNVKCQKEVSSRRTRQKNFVMSGKGELFYVHSIYISDKESLKNSSDLHSIDQKRLKTPMAIRYTFESKFLDILTNQYDGDEQHQLLFELNEFQIGLTFKDKACLASTSNFGFFVMTPTADNDEKFGMIVLHACKAYVNQLGLMNMQKVVLLISQNSVLDLDEPIDTMMKQNYEINQIEYREFAANQSFCMCSGKTGGGSRRLPINAALS